MIKGLYEAATSMFTNAFKQEAIANNLANSGTIGYKKDGIFAEAVSKAEQKYLPKDYDWEAPIKERHIIDMTQSSFRKTDMPLDLSIEGEGFFTIETENGIKYTRDGSFRLDPSGALVTANGDKVLSDSGPIILDTNNPSIDVEGNIETNGETLAKIKIVKFNNPENLVKAGNTEFTAPDGIEPQTATDYNVRQGYLEESNSSALNQMVDMITSFREFEIKQKMVQILDGVAQRSINNLGNIR